MVTKRKDPALHKPDGRPTDFKEEYIELAFNYALMGATDKDLARFFSVDESTINNWKIKFPKFFESLKNGKETADAKVIRSLYERATGYSHDEDHIVKCGGEASVETIKKHYPPDPTSMIFWLKNRQPDKWRDKVHAENTNTNIEIKFEEQKEALD